MVNTGLIQTVLRSLEKYLLKKNKFHLSGETYDMILFVPSDRFLSDVKYSLLISAKFLNSHHQKVVIMELLEDLKKELKLVEYNSISRVNIIHTEDPFVKNIKFLFPFREKVIQINDIPIGGVRIEFAYFIKSLILDGLIEHQALNIEVKTKGEVRQVNAGIIRMDSNFDLVYYTGLALRKFFNQDKNTALPEEIAGRSEDYLIQNNYISKVKFDDIVRVIHDPFQEQVF